MGERANTARQRSAASDAAERPPALVYDAAIAENDPLYARLTCPGCKITLTTSATTRARKKSPSSMQRRYRCPECAIEYPVAECGSVSVPWMFPHPEVAHLEWSARFKGFLQSVASDHNTLNRALRDGQLSTAARRRITNALQAKREFRQQVTQLLKPIGLDSDDLVPAMTNVLAERVPKNQGLLSYINNVFRDWAWENGENEAALAGIEGLLAADSRDSLGAVLTLGAGAGRLACDIHRQFSPDVSVLLDFNPLLLFAGGMAVQGGELPMYEFPVAALDEESSAVLHQCKAPDAITASSKNNMRFVLGDATCAPFADGSFDTAITPWLIDILPGDLREFLSQVNRLLPRGGLWVNTGSLVFTDDDPSLCYTENELLDIVDECGFDIVGMDHRSIPYLQSPHSAHGRVERIVSFAARKREDANLAATSALAPEWIIDTSKSVPSAPEIAVSSSTHLLNAQILAAIDGKRSIDAITQLVAQEYNLPFDECLLAVKRIISEV